MNYTGKKRGCAEVRTTMIRVTIWNEYLHEKEGKPVRHIYPKSIHGCSENFLETDEELSIQTTTFEMPEHGLTDEVLAQTDVLIFGVTCARSQSFR